MTLRENEWFIKVPWGRICVIAWGNSLDPPVLLCHGRDDSAISFRPLVERLPKNFYYIGMEFPGCGRSDRLPPGLMINVYDLVYSIDAVVTHFRWESFALIGHSMGAYIAKYYSVSCPGKITKLVELDLINLIGVPPEKFSDWYQKFFTNYYENINKYNVPKGRSPKITWNKHSQSVTMRTKRSLPDFKAPPDAGSKNSPLPPIGAFVHLARGLSDKSAAATLQRISEPAGSGFIRYTFDPRIRLLTRPAHSPEQIRKIFTNSPIPTLAIVSEMSYKKGLYADFLLDENSYTAKNYRCIRVTGNHDVHVIEPEMVSNFVSQFLLHGLEGLDSKAKL